MLPTKIQKKKKAIKFQKHFQLDLDTGWVLRLTGMIFEQRCCQSQEKKIYHYTPRREVSK